jgi:hypothetical protein
MFRWRRMAREMGLAESVDLDVAVFNDSDDHAYISFFTDMALNNFIDA